jgi:hypothetical protein
VTREILDSARMTGSLFEINIMKIWLAKIHLLAEEFFQYSLITYLILLLAETIKEGFVSFFFNLNILLIVVLASGVIMVLTHNEHLEPERTKHKIKTADVEYTILLATGGAFLVWYKTQDLGIISFVIAGLTAMIILLLSFLLLTDNS